MTKKLYNVLKFLITRKYNWVFQKMSQGTLKNCRVSELEKFEDVALVAFEEGRGHDPSNEEKVFLYNLQKRCRITNMNGTYI